MRRNFIALGFGLLGMALALISYHIYIDHAIFHQILNQIVAGQKQNASPNPNSSGT